MKFTSTHATALCILASAAMWGAGFTMNEAAGADLASASPPPPPMSGGSVNQTIVQQPNVFDPSRLYIPISLFAVTMGAVVVASSIFARDKRTFEMTLESLEECVKDLKAEAEETNNKLDRTHEQHKETVDALVAKHAEDLAIAHARISNNAERIAKLEGR